MSAVILLAVIVSLIFKCVQILSLSIQSSSEVFTDSEISLKSGKYTGQYT